MPDVSASIRYNYAHTVNIARFINRNDPLLGIGPVGPWTTGLAGGNGLGSLTTVESTGHSVYNGITLGLVKRYTNNFEFQAFYTLSWDKSDDDNERDPFSYRYAKVTNLGPEYGYSDRDQRHRFNAYVLWQAPFAINVNASWQYRSAQPLSLTATGAVANTPQDRINPDGSVTERNLGRKDNQYNSLNLRISRVFMAGNVSDRAHLRGLQPLQQQEPARTPVHVPALQLRRHACRAASATRARSSSGFASSSRSPNHRRGAGCAALRRLFRGLRGRSVR